MSSASQAKRILMSVPARTTDEVLVAHDLASLWPAPGQVRTYPLMSAHEARTTVFNIVDDVRRYGLVHVTNSAPLPDAEKDRLMAAVTMVGRFFAAPEDFKHRYEVPNHLSGWVPSQNERSHVPHSVMRRIARAQRPPKIAFANPEERLFLSLQKRGKPFRTRFVDLNLRRMTQEPYPAWNALLHTWSSAHWHIGDLIGRLLETGLHLPNGALTSLLARGPHLLTISGIDLTRFSENYRGETGDIIAGPRVDPGLLTVHSSSYLYCPEADEWGFGGGRVFWTNGSGDLLLLRMQPNDFVIQSGIEVERLTGGALRAGLSAVVVPEWLAELIADYRAQGRRLIRVATTASMQVATDRYLHPLGRFNTAAARRRYPRTLAGTFLSKELQRNAYVR